MQVYSYMSQILTTFMNSYNKTITFANFQDLGNTESCRDLLNIICSGKETVLDTALTMTWLIWSFPTDLLTGRTCKISSISVNVNIAQTIHNCLFCIRIPAAMERCHRYLKQMNNNY